MLQCLEKILNEYLTFISNNEKAKGLVLAKKFSIPFKIVNFKKHLYETKVLNDGWTAVTKDKKLSAQFEHTVGITDNGYEIFTTSNKGLDYPPYKI